MKLCRIAVAIFAVSAIGAVSAEPYGEELPGQVMASEASPSSDADSGPGSYTLKAQWTDERGRDIQVIEIDGAALAVTEISSGPDHTCAITLRGEPMCWGENSHGQLGDNTTDARSRPVKMFGIDEEVISISAGYGHSCLVTASGTPMCTGLNENGQVGDGTDIDVLYLVPVAIEHTAANISAGADHSCLTTTAGAAYCWGNNTQGQLGTASPDSSLEPVIVKGLERGVFSVSAGNQHSCGTDTGDGVQCWGDLTSQW